MSRSKEINNYYFSRLIDSLERDKEQWTIKYCGGGTGWSWTEYYGPEYTNDEGIRLQFGSSLNHIGAWLNGRFKWGPSFLQVFNIFSYQTRRYNKALRNMKRHLKKLEKEKYNRELIKSL